MFCLEDQVKQPGVQVLICRDRENKELYTRVARPGCRTIDENVNKVVIVNLESL